ncbi:MAG: glycosyltransferase [Eubacteriales bacterium]|nr:glycosyltransferase [Eubacteriales bacterium]
MNVLFLTLLYHPDEAEAVSRLSRDGLQNQINAYQWAFIEGIRQNLTQGESLSVLNALPIGVFPTRYRKLYLRSTTFADGTKQLGGLNLPVCKQRGRAAHARREIERWVASSPENRTVLIYSLYLPYLQAAAIIKKRHPDVKITVIVTDLPNELGISSGRVGLMKRIEYTMGRRRTAICADMDGFVLLTAAMAQALPIRGKRTIVIEGLISPDPDFEAETTLQRPADNRPAVLYTGTLNRELGIGELLKAFESLTEAQLWLCGHGDIEVEIRKAEQIFENIHYFGFVTHGATLVLQKQATVLINPRTSQGAFTRYSFPSKTLEYMRSGVPVACCKLEGIPDEYDEYLCYIDPQNAAGIRDVVQKLLQMPEKERLAIGERARDFVLTQKNSVAQCAKLTAFLRKIR